MPSPTPDVRFLLDENLSEHVARGLAIAGLAVASSRHQEALGAGAADEVIVPWCAANGWVWVTADQDARSREIRMGLVPAHGARAILLRRQPRGRLEHVEIVVRHYRTWLATLVADDRPGVWVQPPHGALKRLTR